jgi:hypothetical protein
MLTTHIHDMNDGQMKQRAFVRRMIVRRTIFYNNLTSLTYLGWWVAGSALGVFQNSFYSHFRAFCRLDLLVVIRTLANPSNS